MFTTVSCANPHELAVILVFSYHEPISEVTYVLMEESLLPQQQEGLRRKRRVFVTKPTQKLTSKTKHGRKHYSRFKHDDDTEARCLLTWFSRSLYSQDTDYGCSSPIQHITVYQSYNNLGRTLLAATPSHYTKSSSYGYNRSTPLLKSEPRIESDFYSIPNT